MRDSSFVGTATRAMITGFAQPQHCRAAGTMTRFKVIVNKNSFR